MYYIMDFFFIFIKKVKKEMFKINNRTVQNKRTGEKFGPVKIIVLYLIRIVHSGNWAKKNDRICAIIRYRRVRIIGKILRV